VSEEDADASLAARIANQLSRVFVGQNEVLQPERFAASKERLSQRVEELNSEIALTKERVRQLRQPLVGLPTRRSPA